MAWTWKLVTAPLEVFSTTVPFQVTARLMNALGNYQWTDPSAMEVELGTDGPFIPEVAGVTPNATVTPTAWGPSRSVRSQPESNTIRLQVDKWTGDQWQNLMKMMATGRLFAFNPWWGPKTWWSWWCQGPDSESESAASTFFVGDVGTLALMKPRSSYDAFPSRFRTDGALTRIYRGSRAASVGVRGIPQVPGFLGSAVVHPSFSLQYANSLGGAWTSRSGTNQISVLPVAIHGMGDGSQAGVQGILGGSSAIQFSSATMPGTSAHLGTVWVKGTGTIRACLDHSGTITTGTAVVLSQDVWKKVRVTKSNPTASATVVLFLENTLSTPALIQATSPMLEYNKAFHTAWQGAGASPGNPTGALSDKLPAGAGLTFMWYFQHEDRLDANWLLSWTDGGSNRFIKMTGLGGGQVTFEVNLDGTTESITGSGLVEGTWYQAAVVYKQGTSATVARIIELYFQGILSTSWTHTGAGTVPEGAGTIHILCDAGLTSPVGQGFNYPLQGLRIEAEAWTAQKMADDVAMMNDQGIRAILAATRGRLYEIASMPSGFRGGFLDDVVGDLVLKQVSFMPGGIIQ